MSQQKLPLVGGHHVGPLFIQPKRRGRKSTIRGVARYRFLERRTPAWADRAKLRWLRARVKILTALHGEQYSMDHIVPLRHPLVCGLHVENNIELMPEVENRRKGNNWWPDMPETQDPLFGPQQF